MQFLSNSLYATTLSLLTLTALSAAQDNPRGEFYIKEQVKGFFSLKTELRGYTSEAIGNINSVAFRNGLGTASILRDSTGAPIDTAYTTDNRKAQYNQFGNKILGLGGEVGAQYHQLLTWVDGYFMLPQSSKVPNLNGTTADLQDVRWFHYGFNLFMGWMLAPEQSVFNVIPSLGAGFSLMNTRFSSNYDILYSGAEEPRMALYRMTDRYYSTFGKDLTAQIELRLKLGPGVSIGAYSGIRGSWFSSYSIETSDVDYFIFQNTVGHNWFVGGKVTYTLPSIYETKEQEKL